MSIVYKSLREFYQSFICYINLIRSPSLCESQDFVLTRNGLNISVLYLLLYKLGLILESTVRVMFYVILISALFTVYVLEKEIHEYEVWTIFYRWRCQLV